MKGGCIGCLKCLVTLFNCLLMMIGLAITALFIYVYFDASYFSDSSSSVVYLVFFFIALGAVMAIMGFFGCCGALIESQCMLGVFFFLVLALFVGQTAVCVWCYNNFGVLEENFTNSFKSSVELYEKNETIRASVDRLQQQFKCCGSSGPQDWQMGQLMVSFKVPPSCCVVGSTSSVCQEAGVVWSLVNWSSSQHYSDGCSTKLFNYIEENQTTILAAIIGVSAVELLALIFSFIICHNVRKMDRMY